MVNVKHGEPEVGLLPWLQMWRSKTGNPWFSCLVGDRTEGRYWRYHLWPSRKEKGLWGLYLRHQGEKAFWYGDFWEVAGKKWWLEGSNGLSRVLVFVNGTEPELSFYHSWGIPGEYDRRGKESLQNSMGGVSGEFQARTEYTRGVLVS